MEGSLQDRVANVRRRMAAACGRCGRDPASVRLVAVAKMQPPEAVREAAEAGVSVIGENRVQEARAKIPLCPGHLAWHLVGHLQRNKAAAAVELFDTIHSADSLRLLEALDRACDEAGRTVRVFLEVNVSGEASKFGVKPEEAPALLEAADRLPRVEVHGLMTIPPFAEDPGKARAHFRRLRELRDGWQRDSGRPLPELSMGMTHDFEVAIEEGATWVRVGTAIFGERRREEAE
jgi:hypothetical protein